MDTNESKLRQWVTLDYFPGKKKLIIIIVNMQLNIFKSTSNFFKCFHKLTTTFAAIERQSIGKSGKPCAFDSGALTA